MTDTPTQQLRQLNLNDQNGHDAQITTTATEETKSQVWGPFFVQNAPFRTKISPVWAKGIALVISGRVFGLDTKKPIPFATIDLWHTSPDAEYDYYEPDGIKREYKEELNTHGAAHGYDYRARMVADHLGRYEFETVKPVPYFDPDDSTWRCPHIHYYVRAPSYKPLVTQIYFEGEEKNDIDKHRLPSLTIKLEKKEHVHKDGSQFVYYEGTFDVILAPEDNTKK